ncbi:hypothetical protein X961_5593 [Burkholderia pseudomallei MSHR5613]|nr:hypothetical protein DO64_5715 [Burkholderia pseudomallei]KGR96418.1 hypothetical protein X977_5583 [Burkholderia pseudomallei MSHR7504]KGS17811.1 hypothetical protein X989_5067 [Burkholderia pseudomallei MSHR4378]KGS27480.1 hypothetical protein X962_3963 [Burkholderia pseudomallei MSHR7343]KGS35538.1 hypothetical protein X945_5714 [Burkholderia pseudomallei ABCPW 107]KGS40161.1 hypothetical protein X992_5016 [Burkholderia pseudomallei MSHR5492]KGS40484.1 hypothetical protein X961_5593 [Bu
MMQFSDVPHGIVTQSGKECLTRLSGPGRPVTMPIFSTTIRKSVRRRAAWTKFG